MSRITPLATLAILVKNIGDQIGRLSPRKDDNPIEDPILELQIAAILNEHAKAKLILTNYKVDVNYANSHGNTPLHIAIKNENFKVILNILKYATGLRINAQNNVGDTPLHLAVYTKDLGIIGIILEYGADKYIMNNKGEAPYNIEGISHELSHFIINYNQSSIVNG